MSAIFDKRIHETVSNPPLQLTIYTATGRLVDKRKGSVTTDQLPEYQELRTHASAVKKHTRESRLLSPAYAQELSRIDPP